MDCSFSKDVVFELQQSEQTNFHNVLFNLYAHTVGVLHSPHKKLHFSKKKNPLLI